MVKQFRIKVNGNAYLVEVEEIGAAAPPRQGVSQLPKPDLEAAGFQPRLVQGSLAAPMPGVVSRVCCNPGDKVTAGESILVLEAMKMENEIFAESSGIVQEIRVKPGQSVAVGEILAVIA